MSTVSSDSLALHILYINYVLYKNLIHGPPSICIPKKRSMRKGEKRRHEMRGGRDGEMKANKDERGAERGGYRRMTYTLEGKGGSIYRESTPSFPSVAQLDYVLIVWTKTHT